MKSVTLRGLPHPVSNEIFDYIQTLNARIEKLEGSLNEIIEKDRAFYDECDYCYDEEGQCRADGMSLAYVTCSDIAKRGLA